MSFKMAAFRDGHAHPLFAGREALGPRVDGLQDISEILQVVKDYANSNPDQQWIVGGAYDRSLADTFMASWIDEVVSDRPVVLHASDHHTIWVNSKALELASLTGKAPQVAPGYLDVDENGFASGTLRESGAMELVLSVIPPLTMEQELQALSWAQEELLSLGIVHVQDAWIEPGMAEVYIEAAKRGLLKVRVNLGARITPENFVVSKDYFDELREEISKLANPLLTMKTAKFFADGVLGSATAAVIEPYDSTGENGEPVWDEKALSKACQDYSASGYQLHIHAIGDLGVRIALNAIESCGKLSLPAVIAHAELVSDEDIPKMAKLGVVANMQPLWARPDGMLLSCTKHIGQVRLDRLYRMRQMLDSGVRISFGSDWPVTSPAPLLGIQTAITRSLEGRAWTQDQRISLAEAIDAYTTQVLYQLQEADVEETITLSADPYQCAEDRISQIQVLEVRRGKQLLWARETP